MTEYDVQATEFLAKTGTKMTISRTGECHGFPGEVNGLWRYKYQITLSRQMKQYRFTFYDSHDNWFHNKRPGRYSVLACLETYDPHDLETFAHEYGYNQYDKVTKKTYEACKKQYERLLDMFGPELLNDLRERFW